MRFKPAVMSNQLRFFELEFFDRFLDERVSEKFSAIEFGAFHSRVAAATNTSNNNLYGRDSVWGSLRYQNTVIQEIHKGWRPKTAQHRGGQFPLIEPEVTLERYRKQHRHMNLHGFHLLHRLKFRKFCQIPNPQRWIQIQIHQTAVLPVAAHHRWGPQQPPSPSLSPKRPLGQMKQYMQGIEKSLMQWYP